MKTFTALAAAVTCALISVEPAWGDAWSAQVTPIKVHAENYNNAQLIYIVTSEPILNPDSCSATDGYVLVDPVLANSALATVLTAIATGQRIEVYVSSTACTQNRPTAKVVELSTQ